jgi:GntR family transcriptional regulator, transcriptional repressor for pyruvate dehydrogenase complex
MSDRPSAFQSAAQPVIQPLNVRKLSDQIVGQLETMLLEGSFRPGDRLPPERQLAEQLGVSRPSLREAIQKLAARGLLLARQGGGTYVTERLDSGFTGPWQEMLASHPELHRDVLEFRRMLEGTVARLAAERATEADRERIGRLYLQMQQAHARDERERTSETDVAFHQALADAAHNALFTHLSGSLLTMLQSHVHDNIANLFAGGDVAAQLMEQHGRVWAAVQAGDGAAAQAAAEAHIDFIDRTLGTLRETAARRERAQRRSAL